MSWVRLVVVDVDVESMYLNFMKLLSIRPRRVILGTRMNVELS